MKEAYVSYEVAKLLKEKGFDWSCWFAFFEDKLQPQFWFNRPHKNSEIPSNKNIISSPTQQMACRWLREEYEIDIIPVIRHSLKYAQESPFRDYACRVYDCDGNIVLSATKWYSRYENAVEAVLEYVLTNLI